ncbi:hypothetical protein Mgra_00001587 [Meloidogyne graminicola]|uniref:Uncharacterized protein n=1 Tax=Meloidogyne graminicola TaxID=189291 RepID=A0A8S9ZZD7_9BILA|nr:hypothetical protein Mgra_00001587 [Meloidogyne graminicola]
MLPSLLLMFFVAAPVPSIADIVEPPVDPPSSVLTTVQQLTTDSKGNCMDDGQLFDSALGGMTVALAVVLFWHFIRLCCCKPRPAQQYPPQVPPISSNVASASVRSNTGPSIRSTASERVQERTQKSQTESVRSRTESQKKAVGGGYVSTGTTGTTSSSMRNTSGTK